MRVVKLTGEEKAKLEHLYKTSNNPAVRRRSQSLLLYNDKHSMKAICTITKVERTSLYHLYKAWESLIGEEKYKALPIAGRLADNHLILHSWFFIFLILHS